MHLVTVSSLYSFFSISPYDIFKLNYVINIMLYECIVLASIDCGASSGYVDDNSITWTGDNSLIQNGESRMVQLSNSVPHVMSTLRVFTTRKKNCYLIKVEKNQRVLVRARFYYGNYDQKSSPPSFDLYLDVNYWATVVTSKDIIDHEVIYVVKTDTISVCVALTNLDQFPFISALEVRRLDNNMYDGSGSNYGWFWVKRDAYGTRTAVRYVFPSSLGYDYLACFNPRVMSQQREII